MSNCPDDDMAADQQLRDETEREAMRLTINELEAVVEPLQDIARLTNQYLGGGCCEEHHHDNAKRLYAELSKFEDDSFTALKVSTQPERQDVCVKCHHSKWLDPAGRCKHLIPVEPDQFYSESVCFCKCVFPSTSTATGPRHVCAEPGVCNVCNPIPAATAIAEGELPRWTVTYNIVSKESEQWVGTGWEFFTNEKDASECYQRQRASGNVPTKRPFYKSVDIPHVGVGHNLRASRTPLPEATVDVEAAAKEIARRWLAHDLPVSAKVQSFSLFQLEILAREVIAKHCKSSSLPEDDHPLQIFDAGFSGETNEQG